MPPFTVVAGWVAGVLSLVAFVPYIVAILRGETRPNRATWWIWTTTGGVLLASYYFSGADTTIWVAVSYFVASLVTAVLSIRYGRAVRRPSTAAASWAPALASCSGGCSTIRSWRW